MIKEKRTFKKDVARDAALVEVGMSGNLAVLAMGLGMTPNEAFAFHPRWLAD